MIFDLSINLGNLLTMLTLATGGLWFLMTFRSDVRVIEAQMVQFAKALESFDARLVKLGEGVSKVGDVLIEIARQQERLDAFDQRLTDQNQRNTLALLQLKEQVGTVAGKVLTEASGRKTVAKFKR